MKKFLSVILAVAMVMSLAVSVTVSAAEAHTYGVDNLNNKPGDLIIGFIGGSVTEGSGASPIAENRWSSLLVKNYFKKNYPEKNVIERNAAIGGTTSDSGHTRILGDLQCGGELSPDVVFIEFAINDASEGASFGPKSAQNMESMVRQLLKLPKIPAIVFVYLTKTTSNSDPTRNAAMDAIINAQKAVAENYGIFGIDIDAHIWEGIKAGKYTWNKNSASGLNHISNDTSHPNNFGYGIYADFMIDELTKNKSKAFKKLDPETPPCSTYVYGELEEVHLSDPRVMMSGDWKYVANNPANADWSTTGRWTDKFFPLGYYVSENCVGETVEFEFTGRGIGVQYNRTQNSGKVKWEVFDKSGSLVKSGTQGMYYKQDSTRTIGNMFCTNLEYGTYKVKLTGQLEPKAAEDKNKDANTGGTGTYLGINCFVVEKAMPVIHPVAKDVNITGSAVTGETLSGNYKFECNTYGQGESKKEWYASDSENGIYTKVWEGAELELKAEHLGRFIKYAVTPVNSMGTAGKSVYSDAVFVIRPAGMITATKANIKVDGAASDVLKPGKNTATVKVTNNYDNACTVYLVISLNEKNNGISKTKAVKLVPKTIGAGKTEEITAELAIDADAVFNEGKVMVFASDSLEPAVLTEETFKVSFIGIDETDGASVYEIN